MYKLKYDNKEFEYELIRKKKKTLSITVTYDSKIIISAPEKAGIEEIEKKIYSKIKWIYQKLKLVNENFYITKEKEYISGENFMYIGKNYRLKIENTENKNIELKLYKGRFCLEIDKNIDSIEDRIKRVVNNWYMEKSKEKILERVKFYSEKIRVNPQKISIKNLTKSWGICSKNGNITFNWKIVMAPLSVIDYVVIHELCHLKYHNHSKEFWNLVSIYMSDYKNKKEWLKLNGTSLKI